MEKNNNMQVESNNYYYYLLLCILRSLVWRYWPQLAWLKQLYSVNIYFSHVLNYYYCCPKRVVFLLLSTWIIYRIPLILITCRQVCKSRTMFVWFDGHRNNKMSKCFIVASVLSTLLRIATVAILLCRKHLEILLFCNNVPPISWDVQSYEISR